jgi:hypothetical protein
MATFKGEKLVGKTNYIEWHNNAILYLEINGYMPYIDGTEAIPNKSLYYKDKDTPFSPELGVKYTEKELEYTRNSKKALGAIKSIISNDNIDRFKDKSNPKDLWKAITSTYGETSLELITRYLNKLIDYNYTSFKSIDEYTSQIQSSALYLKELGHPLPNPIIASLIFKGLPSSFDAIASRKFEELAKDVLNIDIPKLISDLISEEARMSNNLGQSANQGTANKAFKPKSTCTYCKKDGHIKAHCFLKYPELKKDYKPKTFKKKDNKDNKKTESSKAIMSAFATTKSNSNYKLILDSRATEHYSPIKEWLIDYKNVYNKTIIVANGETVPVIGVGNIPITINNQNILIKDVYYIPTLKTTLISSKELTNKGWTILFKDTMANLSHKLFKLNLSAKWNYNAYYLDAKVDYNQIESTVYYTSSSNKLDLIHKRLNHINKDYLIKTLNCTKGLDIIAKDVSKHKLANCDSCYIGKFTKKGSKEPFKATENLIYFDIDIAGPFKIEGIKGERYFLTITDRGSRSIWVYPIKFKSDALDILISFYTLIETQFNVKIKALRLDNAKEFRSTKWTSFCSNKGIICEYTSPYSTPQNGISERLNRYLIERIIAICKEKNIPLFLWPILLQL